MSYSGKDYAVPETAAAAVDAVANVVSAIRDSIGYSIEELAPTFGLAVNEIADLESGIDADPIKLRRIAAALRLPEGALLR
ncbi:helix-turn-helix domain-containing protein [Mesorhizobium escarrei]|uniref:XRE family transcriptional regulator n=1 Tax=Mesorhizobium escarrei TaxID=666018 RepID=A0ABM9EFY5_9HYPH|nr:helix-turn-helix transcriptional regulator [Mesorhizobium escarrei]CAH2408204.1 XRE family transcriptional regulator [Mesorhizobium escarrei]